MKKEDRRVKYTKMVLKQSLLDLLQSTPISKITVTSLCAHADINRNTFYTHFSSPYDLLAQIHDELIQEFEKSIESVLDNVPKMLVEICNSIKNNAVLCNILFSEHGDKDFLKKVMYLAHDKSLNEMSQRAKTSDRELLESIYRFCVNGSVAVIEDWIKTGMKKDPQEIASFIDKISNYGLQAFLD